MTIQGPFSFFDEMKKEIEETKPVESESKPAEDVVETLSPSDDLDLPERSEDVVEHFKEKQKQSESTKTGAPVDKGGQVFNSSIHQSDPKTGEPLKTKKGYWQKKRGVKAGTIPKINLPQNNQQEPGPSNECKIAASMTVESITGTCAVLISDEWSIESPEEHKFLSDAVAVYYESLGITRLPPWAMALGAFSVYAGKRIRKPKTVSRFEKIKAWWRIRKAEKKAAKIKINPAQKAQMEKAAKQQAEKEQVEKESPQHSSLGHG